MTRSLPSLLAALAPLAPFATGCSGSPSEELEVFAAASLREVCEDLGADFEVRTGVRVNFNFAGSNLLARQILASDRAEVFLSADELQMDLVQEQGRIDPDTRRAWLHNELAVVVPLHSSARVDHPSDLAREEFGVLSLAHTEAVPAGRYARAWLVEAGLWDSVAHRIVPAVNVRVALAAVASGAADAGIVYATDAATSDRVRVALRVPAPEGPPITYAVAATEPASARALEFIDFLRLPPSRDVCSDAGFLLGAPFRPTSW